jgi:hypothetical protein
VSFSFNATESGRFECRLSGPGSVAGTFQSCNSPTTYYSLADGAYTFSVRATDSSGNTDGTPATRMFTIVAPVTDPGPVWAPGAPSIYSPSSYSWSRSSTLTFTGTAQAGSTVELFDDSTSLGTAVASASGAWSRQVVGLADGAHLISAKASNLGGTSPASAYRVIQIDTRAPNAPAFNAPAAGSTNGRSFALAGTAESGTTITLFENGSSRGTVAVINGRWTRAVDVMAPGTYTYTAKTTDIAGNTSTLSGGWTVRVAG